MALLGTKAMRPSGSPRGRPSLAVVKVRTVPLLVVAVSVSPPRLKPSMTAKGIRISLLTGVEKLMVSASVPKKLLSTRPVEKLNRPLVFWTAKPLPAGEVKVAVWPAEVMAKVGVAPGGAGEAEDGGVGGAGDGDRERGEQGGAERHGGLLWS